MVKVKLSELLKKYKDNKKILDEANTTTMYDAQNYFAAKDKKSELFKTIINGIQKTNGSDKAIKFVENVFKRRAEEDNDFNFQNEFDYFKKRFKTNRARKIISHSGRDNPIIPEYEKIRQINNENKLHSILDVEKFGCEEYENLINQNTTLVKPFIDNENLITGAFSYNQYEKYILEEIDELTKNKDNEIGIDLDLELDLNPYVLDLDDNDILNYDHYKEVFDDIEKSDALKNNPNLKKDIDDLKVISANIAEPYSGQLLDLRNAMETFTNKRNKAVGDDKYQEVTDEIFDTELFKSDGMSNEVLITKRGKENEAKKYDEDVEFIYSDEVKEGLRLALNKIREIGVKPAQGEQGTKVYSFDKLYEAKYNVIEKLIFIREHTSQIKEKNLELERELDAAQKRIIEAEIKKLTEEKEAAILELPELKKAYDNADKQMEELQAIVHKYFSGLINLNTNVDISRNPAIPPKYSKDVVGNSIMNGLYYINDILTKGNVSIDEFINNPGKTIKKITDTYFDKDNCLINDKEKSLEEAMDKIVNQRQNSNKRIEKGYLSSSIMRGCEMLSALDKDHAEHNIIAYRKLDKYNMGFNNHKTLTVILDKNATKTFENIILAGGREKTSKLLEDDYYDPINHKIIRGKTFDEAKFIKNNEITSMGLVSNYETIVKSILKNAQTDDVEYLKQEANPDITMATLGFIKASLEYMQAYQIDPSDKSNPFVNLMVEAIENPQAFVRNLIGYEHYEAPRIDLSDARKGLNRLKKSELKINDAKKSLERKEKAVIKSEKAFDKLMKTEKKELDKKIDSLMAKGRPVDYENAEILQNEYHNKLAKHCNELRNEALKGNIPESFYLNRIEQIMAGAPIGDLKFFNAQINQTEKEYIEMKSAEKNNYYKNAEHKLIENDDNIDEIDIIPEGNINNVTENDINNFKYEFKEREERFKNEKDRMIEFEARNLNKIFRNIDVKYKIGDLPEMKERIIEREIEIENKNIDEDFLENNPNLNKLEELDDKIDNEIDNPNRKRVSIDLNESVVSEKSDFNDGKSSVKEIEPNSLLNKK